MDAPRQYAYRLLLYQAMLDIRAGGPAFTTPDTPPTDQAWRQTADDLRHAQLVAYWLHNLALYSARDFQDFKEDSFWEQHEFFQSKAPDPSRFDSYRRIFEKELQ